MTTALYRRYRPETFAEVIGQEHVTAPLMQALRSGRVNHAYLFSGPRGCGKTTSARILARTLNCHANTPENPIDTPCGECPSCVELARGGPGSLDVVEIDAASHNGVDDARDLRERATFAPARDRYKIFVLDEAHMVTSHGFNALLKIVEEPPPHVKFVFATTEPDKVIGTIRSRTHHYPFRLVPPDVLGPYLDQLCANEGVALGAGVVPLVTRAGGGSVRDTLSVLDQLIAGAVGDVEYDGAVSLLGFTHATLLDDVVDAIAARDGASIFRVVDHVVATGHEPRRFVEDVLERLRDLIVIAVSGDAAEAVLRDLPADQLERMRHQASNLGVSELSRAADLVNDALTEMTGATSPRLHLELLCARLLLPGADDGAEGLAARIDRLERGAVASGSVVPAGADAPVAAGVAPAIRSGSDAGTTPAAAPVADAPVGSPGTAALSGPAAVRAALQQSRAARGAGSAASASAQSAAPAPAQPAAAPQPVVESAPEPAPEPAPAPTPEPAPEPVERVEQPEQAPEPEPGVASAPGPDTAVEPEPTDAAAPARPDSPAAEQAKPADLSAPAAGGMTAEEVRRRWEEVVANLGSPVTRALVDQNAQVTSLTGDRLVLAFQTDGLARNFSQPRHLEAFAEALYQTLGLRAQVEVTVGVPGPGDGAGSRGRERSDAPASSRAIPDGEPDDPDAVPPPADELHPSRPITATAAQERSVGSLPDARVAPSPASAAASDAQPDDVGSSAMSAADAADAAWLAGEPADPASTPSRLDPGAALAAAAASVTAAVPGGSRSAAAPPTAETPAEADAARPSPVAVAPAAPAPVAPQAAPAPAAPSAPRSPRQIAEDAARQAMRTGARPPAAPAAPPVPAAADYDDMSDDDPDITAIGLVGVPLVVKMLDGKVVEEVTEQP